MFLTRFIHQICFGAALICAGCTNEVKPVELQTDGLIFYGGPIVTMETDGLEDVLPPEAVLVQNNQISAISSLEHIKMIAPDAELFDLGGRTLMPGFIDSHVHVRELGMDAIKADLVGVKNAAEMVERLQSFYPDPKNGEWLIGQGWDEGQFASWGYPDRAMLDASFPNNPVMLESLHGFAGFYNGKALDIAGVDVLTPDPEGGTILRRENGEPTGVMLALGQSLINRHIPEPDQATLEKAILAGLNIMAAEGVTSVHEAGMAAGDVAAFQALASRNELPIRVYGLLNGNDRALMADWFDQGTYDDPLDFLDIRSIKVFYDGSLGSRTALMKQPYSDMPDAAVAAERISQSDMLALGREAAQNRFQMAVHAIGDLGNDVTLSQYEQILQDHPEYDHRWRIEHAQVVLPDFFARQSALGVIASMQPSHAVGDSKWAEDRVGPDRIEYAYAWRTILSEGGRLIFNSDLPGEPWTPLQTLHFAVNRQTLDGNPADGWYPEQAVSVSEALQAMTINNAYSAFQEDRLGSLAPGKWADFVILDANPLTVSQKDIKDIQVEQVWVAGRRIK